MQTRRQFLGRASSAGAAAVLAPSSIAVALAEPRGRASAVFRGGRFAQGVMSGDPEPRAITLWTALDDVEGAGQITLEIARDRQFRNVVARRSLSTNASRAHTVKARVSRLRPDERYYYRFETRGENSPVGRFQTAPPADSNATVRFGFFSCQEYTLGYYNAHELLAREDLDFVVNLGDYIYSDVSLDPPIGVRAGNFGFSQGFSAITEDEYRRMYSTYRGDASLQKMHARFPMISAWDDHEVQNNYAGGDPAGGSVTGDPYSLARRNRAYGVFFEQMPTFPVGRRGTRIHHTARFGRTMDLFVLDERQFRAAQPCSDSGVPCDGLDDPRAYLGESQTAFLRSGLTRSRANWKVIANQLLISPVKLSDTNFDGFDAWWGYQVEREALLRTISQQVEDVVFITGDYHAFVAADVRPLAGGNTVAAEFAGGSISAATEPETKAIIRTPGFGSVDAPEFPADELARRRAASPWLAELDYLHHGYVVCEASRRSFKATFKKVQTIRQRNTQLAGTTTYTVRRGTPGIPQV